MTGHRFAFLIALAVCPAFSQTIIMGHHIGENVSQFPSAEPGLQSRIDECLTSEPIPMTPDEIHALSKHDVESLAAQIFANVLHSTDTKFRVKLKRIPNRGELEDLARQGMPISIDKRMPDVIETCHALLLLTQPTSSGPVLIRSLPNSRPRPITWHFVRGALSQIDIDFHGSDFDVVANDLSTKISARPVENKEIDTPNIYGATIHVHRKVAWLTRELYVLLEDEEGAIDEQLNAFVMGRSTYDEWAKVHGGKNSLD